MDKDKLVSVQIFRELFEAYLPMRIEELETSNPNQVAEELVPFLEIYGKLSELEKGSIRNYIEMIISDVASTILGGMDGATDLGTLSDEFVVQYGEEKVTPYLQDYFLEQVELMSERKK